MKIEEILASEFSLKQVYAENIISLLDEGNTIPFIARYRKEMHGSCDDQVLRAFSDRLKYLRNLNEEKEKVQRVITEQGKWTPELEKALSAAQTLTEVEDIYRPYKPKRKTRASVAIANGLEPLADIIQSQKKGVNIQEEAANFVNENVPDVAAAIQGAKDIIAERISDDAELRKNLRELLWEKASLFCTLLDGENKLTYEGYNGFKQEVNKLPSHRILAINRGEKEKCLKVETQVNMELLLNEIRSSYKKDNEQTNEIMDEIIEDSLDRLLFPALERELRSTLTDNACEQAIKMFEVNLKPLLMEAPLKNNIILGLDPAYRTGCKIAVIDKKGDVLDTTVIYPTPPQSKTEESIEKLKALIEKYNVDIVSIGNGTASKEAEIFVAELIKHVSRPVSYAVVSEAGASVYSASKLGAEEFPDYDVSLRSAVSIARRLQDPLAELIKIDVKSIGVGQYQHDMPQARLTEVLTGVVEDCVNSVGVDLNTASPSLLSYVSGLNMSIAKNITAYRAKIKGFKNRSELLSVPKLGPKAFEQCAGFLRITDGNNILDNTGVHPEAYEATDKLLKMFTLTVDDVRKGELNLENLIALKGEQKVADEIGVGVPTLHDIAKELAKPGRDIRESMPKPVLRSDVLSMEDLKEGMVFSGKVRNVVDFGAFVDIGVHQDGLVHISQICDAYIKHPSEVLKVGQTVDVKILSVDLEKKRISLTMKGIEK
ncbi:MAG TPA: RNA-binding transcriptional accessory protein [Clostridiales bacterium]|nr:RNA-binding transcriptional accessory protein [Clostridiales bacterium]